jgi:hypothetical protein
VTRQGKLGALAVVDLIADAGRMLDEVRALFESHRA